MDYRKKCLDYYQKIYKEKFGVPVEFYEVHHIDNCHTNNKIENLLLIPPELHRKYHSLRYKAIMMPLPDRMVGNAVGARLYEFDSIVEYLDCLEECKLFMDMKAKADLIKRSIEQ